jgi:hypothetical protein
MDVATVPARRPWRARALPTPTGLTVEMILTAVAVAVFGITATRAAIERRATAEDVFDDAAPLLFDAQGLCVALADADAAASTIYLRAGLEPRELRQRYEEDLERAETRPAAIAGTGLRPGASAAAQTITEELPAYAGLVEAARADNRQELRELLEPEETASHYGIAIDQAEPDLVRFVDAVLEDLRVDCTWARLREQLHTDIGVPAAEPPPARYRPEH